MRSRRGAAHPSCRPWGYGRTPAWYSPQRGTPLDASHVRRDFRLCAEGWYRGHVGTAGTAAHFVSVMSESGVDVDAIARLARHFSFRTTETIYRHELRTVITTGTDVMDGYAFSRALPYAVYNRISTLSY